MENKIKLIWDFRGPEAKLYAEHHLAHLNTFAAKKNLDSKENGIAEMNEKHWLAFMVVLESDVNLIRKALKPHRAEQFESV